MADAKKCDRCGSYYEEIEQSALSKLADSLKDMCVHRYPQPIFRNDLCEKCEKSLKTWWKGADNEKRSD